MLEQERQMGHLTYPKYVITLQVMRDLYQEFNPNHGQGRPVVDSESVSSGGPGNLVYCALFTPSYAPLLRPNEKTIPYILCK